MRSTLRPAVLAASVATLAWALTGGCGGDAPADRAGAGDCAWESGRPDAAQLTVLVDGRLLAVADDGSERCLAEVAGGSLDWGPGGDRAVVGGSVVIGPDGVDRPLDGTAVGWADPAGEELLVRTGERLQVQPVLASGHRPAEVLAELTPGAPLTAHPDGTHWVVGGSRDGIDGVWVVGREDGEAANLAAGNDVAATELVFSADGSRLWFAARHGRSSHLHVADLVPTTDPDGDPVIGAIADDVDPATGEPLAILPVVDHPLGVGRVVAHPADPAVVAYATGACESHEAHVLVLPEVGGEATVVRLGAGPAPSVPVGFLDAPSGSVRVVVASSLDGCTGPWDLELVEVREGAVVARRSLVRGVDAAAVRFQRAEPAYSFVDVDITGFV